MPRKGVIFLLGAIVGSVGAFGVSRLHPDRHEITAQLLSHPEWVADRPDILERVRAVLMSRKLAAEGSQREQLLRGKWQFLTHLAFTPTIGNPDATRVLIEITDYTCAPCRASAAAVREAVTSRRDVRVAILLLPIGGALAEYAARIAVAAYRQDPDRFAQLHTRLMEQAGDLTQERILDAVRELKFDVDQVERDSQSDETRRYLQQVRTFSEELEISGVPAFLLNDKLVMGGVGAKQLAGLMGSNDKPAAPPPAPGGNTI